MNKHKFTLGDRSGFTLLEVTLFLALSAFMALIAFAGIRPRLRNVSFKSAAVRLEAAVDGNFARAASGSTTMTTVLEGCYWSANPPTDGSPYNPATDNYLYRLNFPVDASGNVVETDAGSQSNCVLNGMLAFFTDDNIIFAPIASLRKQQPDNCIETSPGGTTVNNIAKCYKSTILPETERAKWAKYDFTDQFTKLHTINTDYPEETGYIVGFLQDPDSSARYYFQLIKKQFYGAYFNRAIYTTGQVSDTYRINTASDLGAACFTSGNRNIVYKFNSTSIKPDIRYDVNLNDYSGYCQL